MTESISLEVRISEQTLSVLDKHGNELKVYAVSTAANGAGQRTGSECTPLGSHRIRALIGAGAPVNSVFVGRRLTGEVYSAALDNENPGRDWILTRILWLCGNEPGHNRLGEVDTMRRFIYIHGAPDSYPVGVPGSHGCIRMRNQDVIELFDMVRVGTTVNITP